MDLAGEYKGKAQTSKMKHWHGGRLFNSDTNLVIKLPDALFLRLMSRSLFLAVVLLTLPFGSIFRGAISTLHTIDSRYETAYSSSINVELLNLLFRDLAEEGFLSKYDKALIMSPPYGLGGGVIPLKKNEIDVVMDSDLERQSSFSDETYDFVFVPSSEDARFVDRILKIDGIVVLLLGSDSSNAFRENSNYRVVYIRRYSSIIMTMRKTSLANKMVDSSTKRKLFGWHQRPKRRP